MRSQPAIAGVLMSAALAACGATPRDHAEAASAAPRAVPDPAPTERASEAASPPPCVVDDGSGHALPDTLIVEREIEPPPPRRRGRVIVLQEMDAPPTRRLDRVDTAGRLVPVAPIDGDGLREGSDARPLAGGGFRYLVTHQDWRIELVRVGRDGTVTPSGGPGAGRAPALGGFHTRGRFPFSDDGRFSLGVDLENDDERTVIVRDAIRDTVVSRTTLPSTASRVFLAADSSDALTCFRRDGETWVTTIPRRMPDISIGDHDCGFAAPDLSFIVARARVGGPNADGPSAMTAHELRADGRPGRTVALGDDARVAFDRCATSVVIARIAQDRTELHRQSLVDDGEPVRIGVVDSFIDQLEVSSDGIILATPLPVDYVGPRPPEWRAHAVRLSGGEIRSFRIPEDTAVVTHVP